MVEWVVSLTQLKRFLVSNSQCPPCTCRQPSVYTLYVEADALKLASLTFLYRARNMVKTGWEPTASSAPPSTFILHLTPSLMHRASFGTCGLNSYSGANQLGLGLTQFIWRESTDYCACLSGVLMTN